jgi:3-phytase
MSRVPSRAALAAALALCLAAADRPAPTVTPEPRAETEPVPTPGDAADDPAVWVHPTDPEKSLILGTDKGGGLHVYDADGRPLAVVADGTRPNNVDVLYDFALGGKRADLAVATLRAEKWRGVKVWRIDPEKRTLEDVTAGGVLRVFDGGEPYGCCTYHSRRTGKSYFFANHKDGRFEQYQLEEDGGKVRGRKVRTFAVKSQPEGCVADDELGHLYVGEEAAGVWKFGAEPDAGDGCKRVAKVGENGLAADVEGLTLYCAEGGKGYLIASSQGNNTFKVYAREGDNAFVLTIDPAPGKLGKVSDTDGIAVTNRPTSKRFPKGVFVAQDGKALAGARGRQNFKLYGWEDIAGDRLLVDTSWSPRGR